jgi:hypothetical protein
MTSVCPFPHRIAQWFKGAPKVPRSRMVDVGWIIDAEKTNVIWFSPKRLSRVESDMRHPKSLRFCPAMVDFEAKLFEVPCPIDVSFGIRKNEKGEWSLFNALGEKSPIRGNHLGRLLHLVPPNEWRDPNKPVVQISTPYLFVSDEDVWINQLPPFIHYRPQQLPGLLVGGRFPIRDWPRHLMWAFEWHDTSKLIELKRGEPWFYAKFETMDPGRPVRMVEAEMTPELQGFIKACSGVTNYVGRTFSLFEIARERRPQTLLSPVKR